DAEAARSSMYGQRVAYGLLGISIATGLLDRIGIFRESMAAMLEIEAWKFRAPIFIGDTVRLRLTIEETRLTSRGDRGIVRRRLELLNLRDEIVQTGIITVMALCRPAIPESSAGIRDHPPPPTRPPPRLRRRRGPRTLGVRGRAPPGLPWCG